MIQNLPLLPFEARKSITAGVGVDAQQFASVSSAFANYVLVRADVIVGQLVRAQSTTATHTGTDEGAAGSAPGGGGQSVPTSPSSVDQCYAPLYDPCIHLSMDARRWLSNRISISRWRCS